MTNPTPPRAVDRLGGIEVTAMTDGRLRLVVWPEDRGPDADPDIYAITPAQAMNLMARLPVALRASLKGMFQ